MSTPLNYSPGITGPITRPLDATAAAIGPPASITSSGIITLPGNFLPAADSDFRGAPTGNWIGSGCTVTTTSGFSFSGGLSLLLTATRSGVISVRYARNLAAQPSTGHIMSGYVLGTTSSQAAGCTMSWYRQNGIFSTTVNGPLQLLVPGSFVPVTAAFGSPANVVAVNPGFQILGVTPGQNFYLDLLYFAQSQVQVLIAWGTEPGSTAPQFADMTPFTRGDPPISMTRGRQDNLSEVQPGQLTLTLADDLGWLTPQKSRSPFYPNIKIGRRIQVNLADETGAWHTRFDGQLNEMDFNPGPIGLTMDVTLTAADIMSALSRQPSLASWTEQEILSDSPALHWTLDDSAGSSIAQESSGNNGPPLQLRSFNGPSTTGSPPGYAFAGGAGSTGGINSGMETQTWVPGPGTPATVPAVYFHQAAGGPVKSQQGNWQLQAVVPPIGTGAGQNTTIEAFLIADVPNAAVYSNVADFLFYPFSLASSRTGAMIAPLVVGGASLVNAIMWSNFLLGTLGSLSSEVIGPAWNGSNPGPVGVALVITGSNTAPTAKLYVGGTAVGGTLQIPPGTVFNLVTCGGPIGGYQGWVGQISCLSIWNTALSGARLAAHAQRAQSGAYAQLAGTVIQALAGYAGVPSFWQNFPAGPSGLSYLDYFDLQGQSALQAMQLAEQADGGLLYANAAGQLTYAGRETRMGAGGPQLTLQSGQYEADLGYKMNDQFLANIGAVSAAGITTGASAQNAQALLDYGPYAPNGTRQSPTSLPLLTYNSFYQQSFNGTGATVNAFSQDNLSWLAQWNANSHAQPQPKGASVRVDMATLPSSGPHGIPASQLFAVEINSVIALAGLPSQFPDSTLVPNPAEYFVEGVSETFGISETQATHDLVWYTSPTSQGRAWITGDPVYGRLDSTAVIGRSQPSTGGPVFGESSGPTFPGPPYFPPAYNSGSMNRTGFAGDLDQAGIWYNLAQQLNPPLCVLAVAQNPQSIPNGLGQPGTRLAWDSAYADTVQGQGWLAGFPNWYFVLVPGWYKLYAAVAYANNATGRRAAWFLVSQQASAGGAGPSTGKANVVGTADIPAVAFEPTGMTISAKVYCALGTAIAVQTWQTSGAALNTSTAHGGCMFAARFLGDTAAED